MQHTFTLIRVILTKANPVLYFQLKSYTHPNPAHYTRNENQDAQSAVNLAVLYSIIKPWLFLALLLALAAWYAVKFAHSWILFVFFSRVTLNSMRELWLSFV